MKFDFDQTINRRHTNSLKYDSAVQRGMPKDILPLWVADMDFPAPPCVQQALNERSKHGIFGYTDIGQTYLNTVQSWFQRRYNWKIDSDWLVITPGVVTAICIALRALTQPGDAVLIQQPVYYPFASSIKQNNRKLVVSELRLEHGTYKMDLQDLEAQIIREHVKVLILCNPHNPVGRVWTEKELQDLGEICLRHHVLVISDEIHADFVYAPGKHTVFSDLSPELQEMTITCTAPSKTFNLAGLQLSNIIIPNPELRRKFDFEMSCSGISQPNIMGLLACQAAYSGGEEWLEQLKQYLLGNIDFIRKYTQEHLPEVHLIQPEGTYLVWLDFRELGLDTKQLNDLIIHKAGLWLDCGTMFGIGGTGFQRINVACPRSTVQIALEKLHGAIRG